jgi:cytochrome P450
MMQPHFHRQYLARITDLMLAAIDEGMQSWGTWAQQGEAVNMLNAFNHITMKVIVRTMFGETLNNADADRIGEDMAFALDFMLQNMVTQGIPTWIPVPGRRRYQEVLKRIDEFVYGIMALRRQESEPRKDLLGMLLQLVDDETGIAMTDQQIRDEIVTLFVAGYETTALTLSWGIHHLTQHPDVMTRLTAEIDSVLGTALPTFESLAQLPYTRMVLQEIMRIHPPAFWVPRTAVEDDELDGYHIKAGQMVGVSIYNIHRNPQIWNQPDIFDPERFSAEESEKRHQLAWMPFGAGQRMCLGRDFSMMEGALVLALMVQRYTFAGTGHTPKPGLSTTLRPKDGVWAKIARRS